MVLQELDVLVFCLHLFLGFVQQSQKLWHSELFVYLRSVFNLLRRNTETQSRDRLSKVIRMGRTGDDKACLRVSS